MSKRSINGFDFIEMVNAGAQSLYNHVNLVNSLNVFPVPDGDTGTNMNLTIQSGVAELRSKRAHHIGHVAEALSKGLLMGARGNSGVILSQLFRGFAKSVSAYEEIDPIQFAAALQQGVDTAYKAVAKPVEGTILTVAKDAAKQAMILSRGSKSILELMREVLRSALESLNRTPNLLPILKQAGVVDAGGQGLVHIYEGFIAALDISLQTNQSLLPLQLNADTQTGSIPQSTEPQSTAQEHPQFIEHAQLNMSAADIEFGYCTEFMVKLAAAERSGLLFDEAAFRSELQLLGDSLLIVSDEELVKVHIHSEYPGTVMNHAMNYGELIRIKIENMRDQHARIVKEHSNKLKPYGMVAIASGEGIENIFKSLSVDQVLSGGQTMNPSAAEIVSSINKVQAELVFVLPNNSNIILAAEQARELIQDKKILIIPSKTIPQGISAAFAFNESRNRLDNEEAMIRAMGQVKSGQITNAVRDSQVDQLDIAAGDYLGLLDNKLVISSTSLLSACKLLLAKMISAKGNEVLTVLTGAEVTADQINELQELIYLAYPDVEADIHSGGQPVYHYIFSVE